jgi:hypothetical protein
MATLLISAHTRMTASWYSVLGGSDVVTVEIKQVVDLIVSCEEPQGLAGRFELLHLLLSSARRLVRILRSVVQSPCAADARCRAWSPASPHHSWQACR